MGEKKKILLKSVAVENFGGIANGTYFFDLDTNSVVAGASGNGKSTCYFAYLWALGFNVQGWETQLNGYRLHKKDTRVEIVLKDSTNDLEYTIAKTNKPKYKVDKFTGDEQYSSNEYKYFIDNIELPQKEFVTRIEQIFGLDYLTLELMSNLKMFNSEESTRWNKDLRRKFLLDLFEKEIAPKMENVAESEELEAIREYLLKGYNELQIGDSIKALKSNIKKEVDLTNGAIDEKQRDLMGLGNIDFDSLEKTRNELDKKVQELSNQTESDIEKQITHLRELQYNNEIEKIKALADSRERLNNLKSQKEKIMANCYSATNEVDRLSKEIATIEMEISNLVEEKFDEKETFCPVCNRPYSAEDVESAKKHFEQEKGKKASKLLAKKEESGQLLAKATAENEKCKKELIKLEGEIEKETAKINEITNKFDTEWLSLNNQMEDLKSKQVANSNNAEKQKLVDEINAIDKQLAQKEIYLNIVNRIDELKTKLRDLGMQESKVALQKQALNRYNDLKNALIDECMAQNFIRVKYNFKQWLKTQSGKDYDENYRPICTCTLDDVEYGSLSSGQQVLADVLTSLSLRKLLNIDIPMFIDDVVLASLIIKRTNGNEFEFIENYKDDGEWQKIYLVTDNDETNYLNIYNVGKTYDKDTYSILNIRKIKDIYTIKDCDIR